MITVLFVVSSFIAIAVFQSLTVLGVSDFYSQRTLPMLGETVIEALTVIVLGIAAFRMRRPLHRIVWALIGVGLLGAMVSDALWTRSLWITGQDSLAQGVLILHAFEYVAIPAACGIYVSSFRHEVDLTWPLVESAAVAAIGAGLTWILLIVPVMGEHPKIAATSSQVLLAVLGYPLFIMPTMLVLLTVMRLGRRGLLTSWLLFAAGLFLVVYGDAGWFWQQANGVWPPASLVDFAYMAGHVLIATAGLSFMQGEPQWLDAPKRSATSDASGH